MNAHELPERWRTRLTNHALTVSNGKFSTLGVSAFGNRHVRLQFADGSTAFFRYAFTLSDDEAEEIAVFTEHCGYHIFPLVDTSIEVFETARDAG